MKKGPHKMMLESSRYEKWERDRGGGGGGGGGSGGAWSGRERDRERDRERERLARANQMSHAHAAEPDASSLFPAPFRVTGNRDHVSQQIQHKLGDYHLAQSLIDDPSKSIGIYAEPPSPAPCTRRESEFKKPAHAPQNGRIHHRPFYNKSEAPGSTGAPTHRPPPIRIQNGFQNQNPMDSIHPPIESILKEMKSLPTPVSVMAATPRKEMDNKFIFNPYTNKVQENPQLANDLKAPLPKPGIDNRISNSRSSVSPDVNKDLGLSESDDEVAATTTSIIGPLLSPIGSGSPSSDSSSPSDSESESSSAESTAAPPAPAAPAPQPAQRSSWSLSNFAPPQAQPQEQTYDSEKELRHALADVKGKPSPISDMSDSEASSPSPGSVRRRRSLAHRVSTASSDDESTRPNAQTSPRVQPAFTAPQKRGRPPKARASEERPAKKKRGRPPKHQNPVPPAPASAPAPPPIPAPMPAPAPESDVEPDLPQPHAQDNKTHIFRKVFTPKKSDEGGGKGGKGGKGKGGKGKGQVTIIEVPMTRETADDDERRNRERSTERRNEEAMARVSPPQEPETLTRRREADRVANERIQERVSIERPTERMSDRTSHERIPDRIPDRILSERLPPERMGNRIADRTSRMPGMAAERHSSERFPGDKVSLDRLSKSHERLSGEKIERHEDKSMDRLSMSAEKLPIERMSEDKTSLERLSSDKAGHERLGSDKVGLERLGSDKAGHERLGSDKVGLERLTSERYIRAEADVGSGLKSGRGSERLEEASSNVVGGRSRVLVRLPLSRLRGDLVRALQRPLHALQPRRVPPKRRATPHPDQGASAGAGAGLERAVAGHTPVYYSYFERLPADALSDEERDHKYYLEEATRLRTAAEREQEPLPRVMLYLESVLCFVLTGRVLELELDTKRAFTIYRETIEYIKSIHSMPQRFRASPHSTFSKLDILSLRVQALLYLRMFKMYNREVKEYNKIVQEYQQKPACAESREGAGAGAGGGGGGGGREAVSPLSPSPSPAGSVGSVGSGSASSGYCSLAHSVPAQAHHALLQLTKYYTFLYVAHDLWEQADSLCRLRPNQDLFIAVDRKCGPLSLSSTFRHLVQYVRYAISLLKNAPRE